jgi:hypothetical protein
MYNRGRDGSVKIRGKLNLILPTRRGRDRNLLPLLRRYRVPDFEISVVRET